LKSGGAKAPVGVLRTRRASARHAGGRNSGKAMTYGEAYQRLFPMALEELA
jgi:hypothetical protein